MYPYHCKECQYHFFRFRTSRKSFSLDLRLKCPNCGFSEVNRVATNRVPRRWTNFWCRLTSVPAYRCPECRTKFFSLRFLRKSTASVESSD
jgi:DNA-directed RNA polymerase subunit RPC12/RpoP